MKLFQRLLVAPAALGLMAPLAANAAEVNIQDVGNYAGLEEQHVETTAQFSDVVPGDWAYTALQNLSESYGCVGNAYSQNLKSGQALTRYEAASLINSCLEGGLVASGQGLSQDAARLSNEFGSEMAILKGRVDGLEYRLNEVNAGTFANTTLISGSATFTVGAVDDSTSGEKLHSIYAYGIDMSTSFSGEDSLDVAVIAGNAGTQPLNVLDSAEGTTNQLQIDKLTYSFPVGDFRVTAGPLMDQDDIISAKLSSYSAEFYITPHEYSRAETEEGPGVGATYFFDNKWNASISAVFDDGDDASNGILTREGDDVITGSIGYDGDGWGGGVILSSGDKNGSDTTDYDSWGWGLYWEPEDFPRFSAGYDTQENEGAADNDSWYIAADYDGWGPGTLSAAYQVIDDETNELAAFEVYYNWDVADGISVRPGLFTQEVAGGEDETGAVVETTFKF
ncbi:iron uptake porin [Prochlorococcus marinus]|uniref:SLH domain-containing protein n=1 Tax=Prochlorococcus marinus (strain MIT 9211) TaxID=93059 RepID=A9BA98_PROM4|nr:iron uptake porin [Prochlorococcus marinus]ABX08760.1 Hypothetical protein P9211_08291 [Prochlorococcus marinus str. MIT 9211]